MSLRSTKLAAGFSMAELLVALAITGIILAAVAVAFNASAINYQKNQDLFKAVNGGRQALTRMTTDLRTAQDVDPNEPANQCSMLKSDGSDITYNYNAAADILYLVTNDDLSDADYVLCDNVIAMTFTKILTDDGTDCKSVLISMTVQSGDTQRILSAAAVVRRNLLQ